MASLIVLSGTVALALIIAYSLRYFALSRSSAQHVAAQPALHFHVPHERNSSYFGREDIIQSLEKKLCSAGAMANSKMVVLYGHAGIGKTQCILELCWRLRLKRSNVNIFWVSGEKDRFQNDYSSIATAIEPEIVKHSAVEFLEAVKGLLESGKGGITPWILVVDGVDMADFPYFTLLPRGGGKILFPSRTKDLPVQSNVCFDSIHVGTMTSNEARQMVLSYSPATDKSERTACQKLLCELDHHPAAVAQAAAFLHCSRVSEAPISSYLSEYKDWKEAQRGLLSASQGKMEGEGEDPYKTDGTWHITFNYLAKNEPAAAMLLQVLSCLDPHCIQSSLLYLKDKIDLHPHVKPLFDKRLLCLGMCEADLLEAVDCLTKFCLITRSPDGKNYQLHQAAREATLNHVRSDKNSNSFTNAVLLISMSCSEPSIDAADKFADLLPHVLELTSLRHELCPEVSKCLLLEIRLHAIKFLRLQARASEAVSMAGEAIGRELVRLGTSPSTDLLTLEWYHTLSMSLLDIDKFEEARLAGDLVYQNRLRLFGESDKGTLRSLAHLGWVELSSGDRPKAIEYFGNVLSQTEKDDKLKPLEIDVRRGLAKALSDSGNLDEALANQLQILELEKRIHGEDSTRYLLLMLDASDFYYIKLGEYKKAGAMLEDVLPRLANSLGPAHPKLLAGFSRLGYYYLNHNRGKIDQAELIFRKLVNTVADNILRAGLDPVEMCAGLANVLKEKGTPESLEEALDLAQVVVKGFTSRKGQDHPRTQQAVQDLNGVQKLRDSTENQGLAQVATQNIVVKHSNKSTKSSPYEYNPLPMPSAYRLLQYEEKDSTIHCSLHTVDETSINNYWALSYTWGSARPEDGLTADRTSKIFCDGKELYITQNLFDALSVLRMQPNTFLWVDAICINQNDLEERSSQVALMGTIYSRAVTTIIWLGKPDECSHVVHGLLQQLAATVNSLVMEQGADSLPQDPVASNFWTKIGRPPFTPVEQIALVQFFDRCWFERCWIMQEVILANGAFCICGGAEFEWLSLCNFSLFLLKSGWVQRLSRMKAATSTLEGVPPVGHRPTLLHGLARQCAKGLPVSVNEVLVLAPAIQLREEEIKPIFYRVLQHLVQQSRASNATNPRDKLFAPVALTLHLFSGLVKPDFFAISYRETVEEAYTRASGLIIQYTQSLSLLIQVEDKSFRQISGLPSWVPDFSAHFAQPLDILDRKSFACSAGLKIQCKTKVHHRTLEVHGIPIDTIIKTGPSRKESSIEGRPSSWLNFCLQLDSTYVAGGSSVEAFSRTIIADQRESKTDDELIEGFRRYLLQLCAESPELEERIAAANESGNEPTWPVLEAFEAKDKGRGIPTLEEVLRYRFDISASQTKEAELLVYNSKRYFENAHYSVLLGRRLFQSEKGYIGLCPHSAREGDTIWIMPGCVTPIVLRAISESTESNAFEFVGHAYVHGIMYGELFAPESTRNKAPKIRVKDDLQLQLLLIK